MTRRRLEADLVRRGLAPDVDAARRLIGDRRVLVSGAVAENPSRQVDAGEPVRVVPEPPAFVSRGGDKLAAALDRFAVPVRGRRVLDAGASTGGFSDCVLQRGAAALVAVDVGYGQLHERVAGDPRVVVLDRTNIRHLSADATGGRADLIVADLSFISLRTVLPALLGLVAPGGDLVVLVKPQFEADRTDADRSGGVIVDPQVWSGVLDDVIAAFEDRGAAIMGVMASPIRGGDGNVEFLLHALAPGSPVASAARDAAGARRAGHTALVQAALAEAIR